MNSLEPASATVAYTGHVRNGLVVFDAEVALPEGQEVRVEIVQPKNQAVGDAQANPLDELNRLFARWDEEDNQVPDEVAEEFHRALQENRGLRFRTPELD